MSGTGNVLSLDLASSTGWACGPPDGNPRFGTVRLPSTGADIGAFLEPFERWLVGRLMQERPVVVAFEAPILPRRTTIATTRKLYSLAGVTALVCRRDQVPCTEVHLQQVKRYFAGHGRAGKLDMTFVAERYGWAVADDHQADALGIWAWVIANTFPRHAGRFALGPLGAAA